jgi:hypothetical protein
VSRSKSRFLSSGVRRLGAEVTVMARVQDVAIGVESISGALTEIEGQGFNTFWRIGLVLDRFRGFRGFRAKMICRTIRLHLYWSRLCYRGMGKLRFGGLLGPIAETRYHVASVTI